MMRDLGDSLVTAKDELKELREGSADRKVLTDELDAKNQELDKLKGELEVLRVQNSNVVTDYEVSKASLAKKLEAATTAKDLAETKLKEVTETVGKLEKAITENDERSKEVKEDLRKYQKDLADLRKEFDSKTKSYATEKKKLESQIEILKKEKAVAQKTIDDLNDFKSNEAQLKLDMATMKTSLNLVISK
ncbi:unnamed protein product [Ambrosiozyma monospora]|uniref:Unnamed protein product n=1 Tax=Ambrosiozyma monospora TaxID=43982 RepID=A0ACB5U6N6_AMBMO|nr:unnamed protein product [Ambrosiozyma monospora]